MGPRGRRDPGGRRRHAHARRDVWLVVVAAGLVDAAAVGLTRQLAHLPQQRREGLVVDDGMGDVLQVGAAVAQVLDLRMRRVDVVDEPLGVARTVVDGQHAAPLECLGDDVQEVLEHVESQEGGVVVGRPAVRVGQLPDLAPHHVISECMADGQVRKSESRQPLSAQLVDRLVGLWPPQHAHRPPPPIRPPDARTHRVGEVRQLEHDDWQRRLPHALAGCGGVGCGREAGTQTLYELGDDIFVARLERPANGLIHQMPDKEYDPLLAVVWPLLYAQHLQQAPVEPKVPRQQLQVRGVPQRLLHAVGTEQGAVDVRAMAAGRLPCAVRVEMRLGVVEELPEVFLHLRQHGALQHHRLVGHLAVVALPPVQQLRRPHSRHLPSEAAASHTTTTTRHNAHASPAGLPLLSGPLPVAAGLHRKFAAVGK
mmetsp:Transcript_23934/g.68928  ORF Transcript_23934/g.68928 Transcript_23934/m.68928 type:complete len:425 (+) Transcript_23934:261-1535(+)